VEYRDFENGLPHAVRLRSSDGRQFDLRLALSQMEVNQPIPAAAFEVRIPPGATPITIEELRRNGPLNAR
jgi:outer membrane lipoprotein-sorting protein